MPDPAPPRPALESAGEAIASDHLAGAQATGLQAIPWADVLKVILEVLPVVLGCITLFGHGRPPDVRAWAVPSPAKARHLSRQFRMAASHEGVAASREQCDDLAVRTMGWAAGATDSQLWGLLQECGDGVAG